MNHIASVLQAGVAQPAKADKNAASHNDSDAASADAKSPFERMLQGAKSSTAAREAAAQELALSDAGALLQDAPLLLSIDALVGQTARMDLQGDVAQRNGTAAADGSWLGQALGAFSLGQGHGVQTVAAGVPDMGSTLSAAVALDAGKTQLQQAAADAAGVLQSGQAEAAPAASEEGRVLLSSDWQLSGPDSAPSPALQRVMGQIEQWAAAGAGLQPRGKAQEGAAAPAAVGGETAVQASASGSGLRLSDQAVREAAQTADAGATTEAPEQPPMEDMRFWLQGRQQRAEVVLNHGEQQVRVQVAVQGQQAHVTFLSDAEATRDMLDAELAQLREQLKEQGVELVGVRVQAHAGEGGAGDGAPGQTVAMPWGSSAGAARVAQVAVPVDGTPASASQRAWRAGGVDLYA